MSVDDRKHGLPRIDELRGVPAAIRFLSIEPLLEDLGPLDLRGIHWVIAGCESGPGARACEVDWLRSIRDQCAWHRIPFFLKQAVEKIEHRVETMDGVPTGRSYPHRAIGCLEGSREKAGGVIELPYLDGIQHRKFPVAA